MQRVTVTLDDDLMAELDAIIAERGYQNRSEAIRDLARAGIKEAAPESGRGRDCVAALVYVYDHEARQLSKRLARAYHDQHELSLASLHVHRQPWPHTMARCRRSPACRPRCRTGGRATYLLQTNFLRRFGSKKAASASPRDKIRNVFVSQWQFRHQLWITM